jgi:hypothetical protein
VGGGGRLEGGAAAAADRTVLESIEYYIHVHVARVYMYLRVPSACGLGTCTLLRAFGTEEE